MKRLAGYTAVVLATLGAFVILWQFRSVLILFLLSLVVAAAVRPLLARLVEMGIPAVVALILIYLVGLSGLAVILYLIGGQLINELRLLSNYLVVLYDRTYVTWQNGTAFQDAVVSRLPRPGELSEFVTSPEGLQFVQAAMGFTQGLAASIGGLALVIVLSIYWSADQNHFERLWLSALSAGRRVQARQAWRNMETALGAYVRSEFIQAVSAAVLLGLGYGVMGLTYPVLLALLSGVAWLIPLAGVIIILIAALLVGLASGGVVIAAVAVAYTSLVLLFLEYFLEPRLFRNQQYSGLMTILIMLPLVYSYGLIGFVIAPPLAVALQLVINHLFRQYVQPQPQLPASELEELEHRYQEVVATFTDITDEEDEPEPIPPEIANILERLEGLLQEARQLAPKG